MSPHSILTPSPNHLLRFHFLGCVKEVNNLINHTVVILLDTRVGGASAEVVTKRIDLKLPTTTNREWYCLQEHLYDED